MTNPIKRTLFAIAFALISVTSFAQTGKVPNGWHLLDKQTTGFYGIDINRAYDFLRSKKLQSKPVIVAVIDSGVDTLHEDLKSVLWHNTGEIPGNGIDDDKNGYVDDVYGWNFLGSRDGRNMEKDSWEGARVYHSLRSKWEGKDISTMKLTKEALEEYNMWKRAEKVVVGDIDPFETMMTRNIYKIMKAGDSLIIKDLNKEEYSCTDLQTYTAGSSAAAKAKNILSRICLLNNDNEITNVQFLEELEGDIRKA
ncbi:MAG: peptidase S8, partial [Bacteroidota bacterium]